MKETITKKELMSRTKLLQSLQIFGGDIEFTYGIMTNLELMEPEFKKLTKLTEDLAKAKSKLEEEIKEETKEVQEERRKTFEEDHKDTLDQLERVLNEKVTIDFRLIAPSSLDSLSLITKEGNQPIRLNTHEVKALKFMLKPME